MTKLTRREFLKAIAFAAAGFIVTGFKKAEGEDDRPAWLYYSKAEATDDEAIASYMDYEPPDFTPEEWEILNDHIMKSIPDLEPEWEDISCPQGDDTCEFHLAVHSGDYDPSPLILYGDFVTIGIVQVGDPILFIDQDGDTWRFAFGAPEKGLRFNGIPIVSDTPIEFRIPPPTAFDPWIYIENHGGLLSGDYPKPDWRDPGPWYLEDD
jgi:hypothetical protein